MKNIFFILTILVFFSSCNQKEPYKYYAIDGTEHTDLSATLRHEDHIKELRRLSMDYAQSIGQLSRYDIEMIISNYKRCDKIADACRNASKSIYEASSSNTETFKAFNNMLFYEDSEIRDNYNSILTTIDSLNNVIGLKGYNSRNN